MSDGRTALRRAWDEASAKDRAEIVVLVMGLPIMSPEWARAREIPVGTALAVADLIAGETTALAGAWDVPPVVVATVTDVGFRTVTVTTSRPLGVTLQTVGPS
jgi:hypothetical protein